MENFHIYYTVEDGDTLPKIAEKFYGDRHRWQQIYDSNTEVIVLLRGITLFIPTVSVQDCSNKMLCVETRGESFVQSLIQAVLMLLDCILIKRKQDLMSQSHHLKPTEKRLAEQLISLFENGTTEIQYSYAEHLEDGRGITAGKAGFTTATGDVLEVVKRYTERKPRNPLAVFLPRLEELADEESDDTSGLEGFEDAWHKVAEDPTFRQIQDEVVDRLYYYVAMDYCRDLGLKTPLAKAVIYDTIIQHGDGDDPDGLPALIAKMEMEVGGNPLTGVDEELWLESFLQVRRNCLEYADNEETREVWSESVGRVDVFMAIAESGNYDLNPPIEIDTDEYDMKLR